MVEALARPTRQHIALLIGLVVFPLAVFGHRLDEYLQSTLVLIEPGEVRLQINLTPGVAVARQVLIRIDRNEDGVISDSEAAIYADLVKRDLTVRADGRELSLELTASEFPMVSELRSGLGVIQLQFSTTNNTLTLGPHAITVENRHQTNVSVYLFNAEKPKSGEIRITKQKRSDNQTVGVIEFSKTRE